MTAPTAAATQLADPESGTVDDIVDLDRFALHDAKAARRLAASTRRELSRDGAACLEGFLRASALAALVDELAMTARHAPIRRHSTTVYSRADLEAALDDGDPRATRLEWFAGHVTRDMIPAHSPAQRLYVAPAFKRFIAMVVGQPQVWEYADPLAGLVATVLPSGGRYPWHYDTNEFVVTIMIRKPSAGGQFEYVKDLRSAGDENLAGLSRIVDGDRREVRVCDPQPGDLQIFLGRHSLHQVTEVHGDEPRHVLVLSYADRPGVIGPLDRTRTVYGRVTEAHLVAAERAAAPDGLIL